MSIDKLISADSHVLEPPDLWEKRIYPKFRDRAPRLIREGNVDRWYVDQDMPAGSVGAPSQAGMRYENPEAMTIEADFEDVRPGAYDPHARLKDLEVDGVVGEVCIPTVATRFYSIPIESDLLFACFRAMNDWMAEFSKPYPNILKGIGIISLDDVQDGVKEFERCAKLGLAGVMIPTFQGEERHYYLPEYEPLWATAQEIGIPIVMHVNSQRSAPRVGFTPFATNAFSEIATGARMSALDYWVRLAVGDMIFGGVFER